MEITGDNDKEGGGRRLGETVGRASSPCAAGDMADGVGRGGTQGGNSGQIGRVERRATWCFVSRVVAFVQVDRLIIPRSWVRYPPAPHTSSWDDVEFWDPLSSPESKKSKTNPRLWRRSLPWRSCAVRRG